MPCNFDVGDRVRYKTPVFGNEAGEFFIRSFHAQNGAVHCRLSREDGGKIVADVPVSIIELVPPPDARADAQKEAYRKLDERLQRIEDRLTELFNLLSNRENHS